MQKVNHKAEQKTWQKHLKYKQNTSKKIRIYLKNKGLKIQIHLKNNNELNKKPSANSGLAQLGF